MLRLIFQFFIILTALIIGNEIVRFFHIPFPGSIIGMVLLLIALNTGLVKIDWVFPAADLHFKHMIFLFIPQIVEIVFKLKILQGQSWKLIAVLIISSLLGLLGTGYIAQLFEKFKKGEDEC
ncbi:CidA/LrgA family protein [Bacillus alveayuensis]|uniref:CidA/LrgA family protein n=1 Tax=Aeribacillus alveayuensis TaxID=279215 RepID=UPI0005D0FDD0|nr:CidA/LrgA family protein [Bacillus alveayuensis]